MNQKGLYYRILRIVRQRFPEYPSRLEALGDNPSGIAIGVFCVPKDKVQEIRNFIFDLDEKYSSKNMEVLPIVRDIQVTEEYYPEMLAPN